MARRRREDEDDIRGREQSVTALAGDSDIDPDDDEQPAEGSPPPDREEPTDPEWRDSPRVAPRGARPSPTHPPDMAVLDYDGTEDDSFTNAIEEIESLDQSRCWIDLFRKEPKEHQGVHIGGFMRRFEAPLSLSGIFLWARKNRGGGRFEVVLHGPDGKVAKRKTFEVEGRPIIPSKVVGGGDEDGEEPRSARASAGEQAAMERVEYERRLMEERFERQRLEDRTRTESMFKELAGAITKLTDRETQPKTSTFETALPLVIEYLKTQREEAAAARAASLETARLEAQARAEAVKAQAEAQAKQFELVTSLQDKAEARMAKALEALKPKQESMSDLLGNVAALKKVIGGDDPGKVVRETIPAILKTHMDMIAKIQLHKAGITDGGKEETLTEMVVGRLSDLAENVLPQVLARPTQQPVAPFGGAPQQPVVSLPAPQQAAAGLRGGAQIVTPAQQAAHEHAERAAREQAQQQAAAAIAGAPQTTPAPSQVPAPAAVPVPAPPPQAQQDISNEAMVLALQYLQDGKSGRDLASDIEEAEQAHQQAHPGAAPRFFSRRFYGFMSSAKPEIVMATILPYLQPVAEAAPLLDVVGQSFLREFFLFFSEELPEAESTNEEEGVE